MRALLQCQLLANQHGQAVRLFAGGAAGRPHAYLVRALGWVAFAGQLRQHMALQGFEGFAVAEEIGHANQHVGQQRPGFRGVLFQVMQVGRQVCLAGHMQAALDAPQHRGALVVLEVVAGIAAQLQQDLFEHRLAGLGIAGTGAQGRWQGVVLDFREPDLAGIAPQLQQLLRHFCRRQHQVDHAGLDGGAGHAVVLGVVRVLRQGHTALLLDPRQAHGAVGTGTGQHHAEGVVLVHVSQVTEEQVDGHVVATAPVGRGHAQVAIVGGQAIGR
ncbi:hypothetical protein D3C72_1523940 [compost metagenome]